MTWSNEVDSIQYPRVLGNFSRAEKLPGENWAFYWTLGQGGRVFDGHYPHQPVLAAVFIVEMALIAVEHALRMSGSKAGTPFRIDGFRFYKGLLPGDQCVMRLSWKDPGLGQGTAPEMTVIECELDLLSAEGEEKVNGRVSRGRLCMQVVSGNHEGETNAG